MENKMSTAATELRVEHVVFSRNKKRIKAIYEASFPKNERMPFAMMVGMSCLPTTKFLAFYDGDTLCGFVYMGAMVGQAFIMFFAVDETLRSKGYGGRILSEVRKRCPNSRISVSIERCDLPAEDLELRKRRKAFYMRNGYEDTGYMIKLAGVVQEILTCGGFRRVWFSIFLAVYSCLAIIPRIWKREEK